MLGRNLSRPKLNLRWPSRRRRSVGESDPAAYKQSTDYYCGPASLLVALKLLGIERSEAWLAKIMRTSGGVGTNPSAFADVLRNLRVEFAALKDATIQDIERFLSRGLPVLVAWTLHGDGHYSVVTEASGAELSMVEPFDGETIKVNTSRFLKLWHDPCDQTTRWLMVVGEDRRTEGSPAVERLKNPRHF